MAERMKKRKEPSPGSAPPFERLRAWHVLALLTIFVAFFFRDILTEKAFFWEDFIYQYYAFRNFAATSLASGVLPLWNPYTFSGMPFQADIQTALFYLPNLLLTLFVSGGKLYFLWVELLIIAHFVLAGFGTYLYTRELGLEKGYALFSGATFAFSGFMIMQVIHQTFVCHVAWVPLILLFLRRALLRRSPVYAGWTALTLGHAILAGSPQFTVYIFLLLFGAFLLELWPAFREKRWRDVAVMCGLAGAAVAIAVGLTAVQLFPTMELAKLSQRAEITFEKSAEGSFRYQQILTFIAPKYFGESGAQGSGFWLDGNYWAYWETCMYLGLVPLFALVVSFGLVRSNRTVLFFLLVLVFGLLYSLGDNFVLHGIFFRFVPGFDKFRVPGRMAFYVTFAGAVMAGFGFRRIVGMIASDPKVLRLHILGFAAAGVFVWLLAQIGAFQPGPNFRGYQQIHEATVATATRAMVLTLVVAGLFLLAQRRVITPAFLLAAALVFHQVDMNIFGFEQNNGGTNPEAYYARTAELVSMLKEDGAKEYFRINARQGGAMLLDRNQGMIDRIAMCEGYTPLVLQRNYPVGPLAYDLLNAKYRIRIDTAERTMAPVVVNSYLPRAWVVGAAKVFTREADERAYMESAAFRPAREVVLEEPPAIALAPDDTAVVATVGISSYSLNEMAMGVSSSGNGVLVVSEIHYPGWRAYIDDRETPVYRADWCLRAIAMPAGDHRVVFRFEPGSFRRGALTSAASGAVLLLLFLVPAYRRSRSRGASIPPPGQNS